MFDPKLTNIFIKFSYDGKNYNGSAYQTEDEKTISSQLVNALKHYSLFHSLPVFAGRTDRGVSARNMAANIFVINFVDGMKIGEMLNKSLPNDIFIKKWCIVDDKFDARHDCTMRHYKYFYFFDFENILENSQLMSEWKKFNFKDNSTYQNDFINLLSKSLIDSKINNSLKTADIPSEKNNLLTNEREQAQSEICSHNFCQDALDKFNSEYLEILPSISSKKKPETSSAKCLITNNIYTKVLKGSLFNYIIQRMQKVCHQIENLDKFENLCKKSFERDRRRKGEVFDSKYYHRPLKSVKILPVYTKTFSKTDLISDKILNEFEISKGRCFKDSGVMTQCNDTEENGECSADSDIYLDYIYLDIKGKSFLHNMVRRIFHTIFQYGICSYSDKDLENIIYGKKIAENAPSQNLMFCCAHYDQKFNFIECNKTKANRHFRSKRIDFIIAKQQAL